MVNKKVSIPTNVGQQASEQFKKILPITRKEVLEVVEKKRGSANRK